MTKSLTGGVRLAVANIAVLAAASAVVAQDVAPQPDKPAIAAPGGETWYYRASPEREQTYTVAQQKAQLRGAQRMARLEAMRWYGFSNSRPTASALAWTTMYSPAWQQPGGRPFAWHVTSRPVVIIANPTPAYR